MEVFNRWKTARAHLHEAVQSFLDASVQLHMAAAHGSLFHRRSSTLDELIRRMREELADNAVETKLAASQAMANRIRNLSPALVPVNILPSELLSRIFQFFLSSDADCSLRGRKDPAMLVSSVCSRWRQIAVTTRSLWSHIHLRPTMSTSDDLPNCSRGTELWLERAGTVPLHIHVLFLDWPHQRLLSEQISALEPYLPHILSVESQTNDLGVLMDSFLVISQANALKYLSITFANKYGLAPDFSWSAVQLRGLVNLQLTGLSASCSPSLDQLTHFLADGESLQVLRLRTLKMAPGTPTAVHLPSLRLLDVTGLDSASLTKLLSVMTPGNAELDLRISFVFSDDSSAFEELIQFVTRSNIVSLFVSNSRTSRGQDTRRLISSTPLLRVLVVVDHINEFEFLEQLTHPERDEELEQGAEPEQDKNLVQFSNLHTLGLIGYNGLYDAELHIKGFADMHSLDTIILEDCKFAIPGLGTYEDSDGGEESEMERFIGELSEQVEVVCQTDEVLTGGMRQVDLNIEDLIRYSGGMSDRPLIVRSATPNLYMQDGSWQWQ